jgi:hypothetical protein
MPDQPKLALSKIACLCMFWLAGMPFYAFSQADLGWQSLDTGLDFALYPAPIKSAVGDNVITLLRVDPAHFTFELASSALKGHVPLSTDNWAQKKGYTLVANAGMFREDGKTNVGYMRLGTYVNNPDFTKNNCFFVAGITEKGFPSAQVIDRTAPGAEALLAKYEFVSQGIRMIDSKGKNQWAAQDKKWSAVLVANDLEGKIVFVFTRSPYTMHELIDMLLASPFKLGVAMYLEGGPEASLFLQTHDCKMDLFGSYETGFFESDANDRSWPIPNVIGVKPRK